MRDVGGLAMVCGLRYEAVLVHFRGHRGARFRATVACIKEHGDSSLPRGRRVQTHVVSLQLAKYVRQQAASKRGTYTSAFSSFDDDDPMPVSADQARVDCYAGFP